MPGTEAPHLISRALLLAVALVAAAGHAATPAAAGSAERAGPKRVVVTPRQGQVFGSHRVKIRVRARGLSGVLGVRLNGERIGGSFSRPRRGVRSLQASISYGLKRGRNVLRVRVRRRGKPPRRARVRFRVRRESKLAMVGAGRNRRVAIGSPVALAGAATGLGASPAKLRWKVVTAPDPLGPAQGDPPPLAGLTSPTGPDARFEPSALGSYVVKLTHGSGRDAVSDRVRVDAVPPNPLVAVKTERYLGDEQQAFSGIEVGGELYENELGKRLQVVVLDRKTLAPVSNEAYQPEEGGRLAKLIEDLDDTDLVIVSAQGSTADVDRAISGFDDLLKLIGVPGKLCGVDCIPTAGRFSAIGVPGLKVGEGDWSLRTGTASGTDNAGMVGFLSPDQYLNYGFVPSEREQFRYGAQEVPWCNPGPSCISDYIGYKIEVRDAHTLAPGPGDGEFFPTNGRTLNDDAKTLWANRMADALNAVPKGDLVTIQVASNRISGESSYPPPVGKVGKAAMSRLADAVAKVGGTPNAFNRTALLSGAPASGGAVYTLLGWAGAEPGEGVEAAAGVDGAGDAPVITGVLRPGNDSEFRPAEVMASADNPHILQDLIVKPPTGVWPLDDDPGAKQAISYLGSTDQRLGPDPRSAYWTQSFDEATTNAIIAGLKSVRYPSGASFTEEQFEAARAELVKELGWVGNVRTYLTNLSKPFADNALPSWVAAQKIADQIYDDVNKPQDEVAMKWIEFTRIILGLLGPLTHEVTGVIGHMLDLGVWAYGASQSGAPTYDEVKVKADELGAELVEQAQQAQATYARIGDVIVSDYDKLAQIGQYGGCNVASPGCPPELALSNADRIAASADAYRSIERVAYTKLLPLGYHMFALKPYDGQVAPFPPNYQCGFDFPWGDYGSNRPYASWAQLVDLDPVGGSSTWAPFVFSAPPGISTKHGSPPGNDLLERMFDPVSRSGNPKAGGLGISREQLSYEADHDYWFGSESAEARRCGWLR